mgnify:CR=1 FL=1
MANDTQRWAAVQLQRIRNDQGEYEYRRSKLRAQQDADFAQGLADTAQHGRLMSGPGALGADLGLAALGFAGPPGALASTIGFGALDAMVGEAGEDNVGDANIAIGSNAMGAVNAGGNSASLSDSNIAIGVNALLGGTFGDGDDKDLQGNIAIGHQAFDGTQFRDLYSHQTYPTGLGATMSVGAVTVTTG